MIDNLYVQVNIDSQTTLAISTLNKMKTPTDNHVAVYNYENMLSTGKGIQVDKKMISYSILNPNLKKEEDIMVSEGQVSEEQAQQNKQAPKDHFNYKQLQQQVVIKLQYLIERVSQLTLMEACEYLWRKLRWEFKSRQVLVAASRAVYKLTAITTKACINIHVFMKCNDTQECQAIIIMC